jgi:hypothetical protein
MNFKTLIIISFSIISSQLAFAVELPISCEFNHHAFALYNDGTGKAVDNQEQMVATKFDFKSPNPVTSTIAARTFQVYTECLIVSHQGATALAVPAIHMAIMDPISKSIQETDIRLDVSLLLPLGWTINRRLRRMKTQELFFGLLDADGLTKLFHALQFPTHKLIKPWATMTFNNWCKTSDDFSVGTYV